MSTNSYRGRIAPSPTGYLHLGHAKTFWTAFRRCREAGGTLVYRDEDIDPFRCKPRFAKAAVEDLTRLGILWDEGPVRQSKRLHHYRSALEKLARTGAIYPCPYSRKYIQENSVTRLSPAGETLFPQSLRPGPRTYDSPLDFKSNWRFRVPEKQSVFFSDLKQGPQSYRAGHDFGDFLVWRKEGVPSYELAVVVDDGEMRITEVVRGADLLVSTARQWLLYKALQWIPPEFYHEDLVRDDSGERLAKRKDSLALRVLFKRGHTNSSLQEMWAARP